MCNHVHQRICVDEIRKSWVESKFLNTAYQSMKLRNFKESLLNILDVQHHSIHAYQIITKADKFA